MNQDQAFKLYVAAGGNPDHSDSEKVDIHKEVEVMISAKSDRSAGRTIDWWGCWEPRRYTATAFARRVRQAAEKGTA